MENLETRLRFVKAKINNLLYYKDIDDRERTQYIHVLKDIRDELIDLVTEPLMVGSDIEYLRLVLNELSLSRIKNKNIDDIVTSIKTIRDGNRQGNT